MISNQPSVTNNSLSLICEIRAICGFFLCKTNPIPTLASLASFASLALKEMAKKGKKWRSLGQLWRIFGTLWRHLGQVWHRFGLLWQQKNTEKPHFKYEKQGKYQISASYFIKTCVNPCQKNLQYTHEIKICNM